MIARLEGKLLHKAPPTVLVDVNGLGYEVDVPMSTLYDLPQLGEKVVLLTHFVVREDAQLLYGFLRESEREAFRLLLKISGVGPRTALSLLSGMSVDELAQAVSLQEADRLTRIPGIGKKTAERLLLELKGKFAEAINLQRPATDSAATDVLRALLALGYSEKEASAAIKGLPEGVSVSEGIKLALKAHQK